MGTVKKTKVKYDSKPKKNKLQFTSVELSKKDKKKSNIEIMQSIIGGKIDKFGDNSQSWILLKDKKYSICILFDGKGDKYEGIVASTVKVEEKLILKMYK